MTKGSEKDIGETGITESNGNEKKIRSTRLLRRFSPRNDNFNIFQQQQQQQGKNYILMLLLFYLLLFSLVAVSVEKFH